MINLNNVPVINDEEDITQKMKGYTSNESELLTSCWVDISVDFIIGDDKKQELYWNRITEAYNKNRPKKTPERTAVKLRSHWNKLRLDTLLFSQCYQKCSSTWPSGFSDADILKRAHDEFKVRSNKRPFKHVKVWDILKEQPKFMSKLDGSIHSSKRTKNSDSSTYTSSPNPESVTNEYVHALPEGQKAAKRNLKGKGKGKEKENQSAASYDELKESFLKTHNEIQEAANAMQHQNDYHIVMKSTAKMSPKKK